MFNRILSLYDFSWTGRQALRWAVGAGETFHSEVTVLHVSHGRKDDPAPASLVQSIREEIDREIRTREAGTASERPGLKNLQVTVLTGHVASTLIDVIAAEQPDLVVLGTHGQTGLLHVLLGSVAEKIVRHSPSPTLVVRGAFHWPPRCLLLPLDFDDSAEEALLAASELRRVFNARVEAIHVVAPPAPMAYPPEALIAFPAFNPEAAERAAGKRLREIADKHPSLPVVPHVTTGQAAARICEKAREIGADLILIPTHGRSGLSRLLIGSVAEQVVRYAPCQVLSFQPGKFFKKSE